MNDARTRCIRAVGNPGSWRFNFFNGYNISMNSEWWLFRRRAPSHKHMHHIREAPPLLTQKAGLSNFVLTNFYHLSRLLPMWNKVYRCADVPDSKYILEIGWKSVMLRCKLLEFSLTLHPLTSKGRWSYFLLQLWVPHSFGRECACYLWAW